MATHVLRSPSSPSTLPHLSKAIAGAGGSDLLLAINTALVPDMATVNTGRRTTIRSATLLSANRLAAQPSPALIGQTVAAWDKALTLIRQFADLLTPESIEELDDLVAEIDDPTKPLGEVLQKVALEGMGFSLAEYNWLVDELQRAGFRILLALSDGDPAVLKALAHAGCSGDNGILQVGFVTLSTSEVTNTLTSECVTRARLSNLTASVFHLLPGIILAAATLGDAHHPLPKLLARIQESRSQF